MLPPPTPIVKLLLILNFVVFGIVVLPQEFGYSLGLADQLALYYPTNPNYRPYQLLSHFFMHANVTHIAFNMLTLYFFGPILEQRLGNTRFLLLYFLSAFGSLGFHLGEIWLGLQHSYEWLAAFTAEPTLQNFNAFFSGINLSGLEDGSQSVSMLVGKLQNKFAMNVDMDQAIAEAGYLMNGYIEYQQASPVVGASGAISGILAAFAVFYPWQKVQLLFIPIGIPAVYLITVGFLADLYLGYADYGFDNVAHFAHVGGGVTGAILAFIWLKTTTPPWLKRVDRGA